MTTLESLARQYAANNPTRDGGSWAGWCASLMYRFNDADIAYPTATAAGNATGLVSTNPADAPIGAVHYWYGAGGDGHVAQEVRGGGAYMFMASAQITESLGSAIGFVSFADYAERAPGMDYRGWGYTYGANPAIRGDDSGGFASLPATGFPSTPTDDDATKEINMDNAILLEKENTDGTHQWALFLTDTLTFIPIWTTGAANAISAQLGARIGKAGALVPVVQTEWDGFVAASAK